MQLLDWFVLAGYGGLLLVLLTRVRRARTTEDFAVGSRQIPAAFIFGSLAATYIGPGYSIGLAGKVANEGLVWLLIYSAFCIQTIMVGLLVTPRLRRFAGAMTVGDVMAARYGRSAQFLTGLISVALLTGFTGVMIRAAAELLSSATGLPLLFCAAGSSAFVLLYGTWGGIKADILSDLFQFVVLSIVVPFLFLYAFIVAGESLASREGASQAVASGIEFPAVAALFLSFLLGETLIPPYAVRALASDTPKTAGRSFVLAGIFGFAWFCVCSGIGIVASNGNPRLSDVNVLVFLNHIAPAGVHGLIVAAMISIIMSSWDSLLNCAAVSFRRDIMLVLQRRKAADTVNLHWMRALNLAIGASAFGFAMSADGIVEALVRCYSLWAPTIVLPLVIGAVWDNVRPAAGVTAIIAGGIATTLWEVLLDSPAGIPSVVAGVAINQGAFWVVQLLCRRQSPKFAILSSFQEGTRR